MAHMRQQIREAVATALAGLATTGARVYTAHPFPLDGAQLPGLVVHAPQEQVGIDADDLRSAKPHRLLTIVVVGYAEGEAVENTLDTICAEVEAAIAGDDTLGGLAKYAQLAAVDVVVEGETRKRAGEIRMTFQVLYRAARSDPSVAA